MSPPARPRAVDAPPTGRRPAAPALAVRGLRYAYPDGHRALDGVDLEVAPGERVAVLGPNGAGKTTLILHLNGILTAQEGTVAVGGRPVARATLAEVRRTVGVVFQDPDDQLFMASVAEDLAFGPAQAGVRGAALDARVDRALAAVASTPAGPDAGPAGPGRGYVARRSWSRTTGSTRASCHRSSKFSRPIQS